MGPPPRALPRVDFQHLRPVERICRVKKQQRAATGTIPSRPAWCRPWRAPVGARRDQWWWPWPAAAAGSSLSGLSDTRASVVSRRLATDAAFMRPERTTLVGSMTPALMRSS